jgi:nucleoside phosphorylase
MKRSAVFITALPVEYVAVRSYLSKVSERVHKGTVFEVGKFDSGAGDDWQVLIVEAGVGNSKAAVETERAIDYAKPSVAFFVGVAGGLKDVRLCDVVAATKIYGYESGKEKDEFEARPNVGESSYRLVQRARAEARNGTWTKRIKVELPVIPRAYVGAIAAGEKVLAAKSSPLIQLLRTHYSDTLAIEMEGRGFLEATHANPEVASIVIRGISDLIDEKTATDNSGYQNFASHAASAFAFQLLAALDKDDWRRSFKQLKFGAGLSILFALLISSVVENSLKTLNRTRQYTAKALSFVREHTDDIFPAAVSAWKLTLCLLLIPYILAAALPAYFVSGSWGSVHDYLLNEMGGSAAVLGIGSTFGFGFAFSDSRKRSWMRYCLTFYLLGLFVAFALSACLVFLWVRVLQNTSWIR